MDQRMEMLEGPERFGITVGETCALYGVSRETFYYWKRRLVEEGVGGLEDRSTAPRFSPGRIPGRLEGRIVAMRKAHPRWGARRIRAELKRQGVEPPARSTIDRVLKRNGLGSVPAPKPLPPIRFQRELVNELWQMDAKDWELVDGTEVRIISCLDDRSRFCCAVRAFPELSGEAAITVFEEAAKALRLPESVLADRGAIFTGRTQGTVSEFERHLWAQSVYTINGRPYHPQTQGKVERYHRTLREWLTDEGPFPTLEDLNSTLADFAAHYNHERPHQALGDATPAEVWAVTAQAGPNPPVALERCRRETLRPTAANGNLTYANWVIGLGRVWNRTKVRIVDLGNIIEIWAPDGTLIRKVEPDPTRRYLGTGQPHGRPPKENTM